jgi:hypothetical protein
MIQIFSWKLIRWVIVFVISAGRKKISMATRKEKLKKKIIEITGEDPIDMFGETDWELYAEEFIEEQNQQIFSDKYMQGL